jgi:hypothetical protein
MSLLFGSAVKVEYFSVIKAIQDLRIKRVISSTNI